MYLAKYVVTFLHIFLFLLDSDYKIWHNNLVCLCEFFGNHETSWKDCCIMPNSKQCLKPQINTYSAVRVLRTDNTPLPTKCLIESYVDIYC